MNKAYLIIACLFFIKMDVHSQGHIIPEPVATTWHEGHFLITPQTTIITNGDKEQKELGDLLITYLKQSTGYSLKQTNADGHTKNIRLLINKNNDTTIGDEGYHLTVSANTVYIKANKPAGLFYGIQTLVQLLPVQNMSPCADKQDNKIPAVTITDYPRFKWRGLMLDVCRHFFTVQDVKKLIDEMVKYKYNLLHLHLSDDQGWRIEIKSLPELTKIGAWRVPRTGLWWDRQPPQPGEKATDGGFYTQDQIRDIIKYAAEKSVQVMPEIDVPGHSLAAIAAYPYLSCTKMNYQV